MGVSVGGLGVNVVVGVDDGVDVQLGVKVNVGRGVLVGLGVGVGACTNSLPTEQPRLPARATTSNKPGSNLRLINQLFLLEQDEVPSPLTRIGTVGQGHYGRNLLPPTVYQIEIPGAVNERPRLKRHIGYLGIPAMGCGLAPFPA